ncbi:hypothetical protein BURC_02038 [Burkholderiaceae bacterium]|nr:hypothetical protein BURC_02038 [Burkholderiaceae bacterium]
MRRQFTRQVLSCAFGLLGLMAQVQAVTVDFESVGPDLYFDSDTFSENGYQFSVIGDLGTVDTAAAFVVAQAPIGNDTQFYSGFNDSMLGLASLDGRPFRLTSFDAAFVAPEPQAPGVMAGRIVVSGIDLLDNTVLGSWDFAASDASGLFAFQSYSAGLASLGTLKSATFGACLYVGNDCVNPADNLAQFSLDNINVVAVPEPSTYALLALGLAAVALRRRASR